MNLLRCTNACVIPLTDFINNVVNDCLWPVQRGSASITPAHKNFQEQIKVTIDMLVYCPLSLRFLKNYSMINFQNIWKTNYHHSYVVSKRNIVLNLRYHAWLKDGDIA